MKTIINDREYTWYKDDDLVAKIDLIKTNDNSYILMDTFVSPEYRGKNKANEIIEDFYNWSKKNDFRLEIVCSFARDWFINNPEKQDIVIS